MRCWSVVEVPVSICDRLCVSTAALQGPSVGESTGGIVQGEPIVEHRGGRPKDPPPLPPQLGGHR